MTIDANQLLADLATPDVLSLARQADALRRERWGNRTTFTLVRTLDCAGDLSWSPISGMELPEGSHLGREVGRPVDLTSALLERAHPAAGDYQVLPPSDWWHNRAMIPETVSATADGIGELMAGAPENAIEPTLQVGTASDWLESGVNLVELESIEQAGLFVISDGVWPRLHPAFGAESGQRWSSFWRKAADAGLRGNATVLYGPDHGLKSVVAQLGAIAAVQKDTKVFASVAPVVYSSRGFGGPADGLLTQGQLDLRMLAACRLGLPDVDHLRMIYARSDLKMAHLSLACGVDDLEGPLFDRDRDAKANTESPDLSLSELDRWLAEAGYEATLRNGAFERIELPEDPATPPGEPNQA